MAATVVSLFTWFFSLLLLLIHVGCFAFIPTPDHQQTQPSKKRKVSPASQAAAPLTPSRAKANKSSTSSSWSFLKGIFIFSSKSCKTSIQTRPSTPARSSHQSVVPLAPLPEIHVSDTPPKNPSRSCPDSDISADNHLFPLRNDIFPCTACGEIFHQPQLLEQHQTINHAVSELIDGDSGKNIIRIIFETGWTCKEKTPKIQRILKIHNPQRILYAFEEYRETVKAKAAARNGGAWRRDERCIADGNELLRFHCSTFLCDLGLNGNASICGHQFCNICGIIQSGFSPKLDEISTLSSSWRAHVAMPEDVEEEFKFMNVKRAMLVCRVVAGRVGCESDDIEKEEGGGDGLDSVVGRSGDGAQRRLDGEDLVVFNPTAVLPCFVIVYSL